MACRWENFDMLTSVESENAGGVPEGSRGLSESASDTPGRVGNRLHPGGVPEVRESWSDATFTAHFLAPFQGAKILSPLSGGIARGLAQPPATFWQPSGLQKIDL